MDFSPIALDDETAALWKEARAFFEEHVTEEVLDEERRSGAGFSESLHLAMGARGWVVPNWPVEQGGAGLDPVGHRLIELEMRRSGAPGILRSTTLLTVGTIKRHADPSIREAVLAGVAAGRVRICLGYTEPDAGSDLASVRCRARQDGDEWRIDGQKMFTTAAQHAQYCFLLARTNPDAPKHRGLSVFLVPLDTPGIEIAPVGTLGGERTNFVYYDDVRVPDRYRLGGVDDGWTVVHGALDAEHGLAADDSGLGDIGGMHYEHATQTLLSAVEAWVFSGDPAAPPAEDRLVRMRLGRAALNIELSAVAPSPHCRILSAETLLAAASDLLDLTGQHGILRTGASQGLMGGIPEQIFRFAPGTSIYGGTTEVFKNMIAEGILGLPRSTPKG